MGGKQTLQKFIQKVNLKWGDTFEILPETEYLGIKKPISLLHKPCGKILTKIADAFYENECFCSRTEKTKQTNLKRYGVENVAQNEDIKEKMKQTNFKQYGVEYVFQLEEIKEKVRQTNLERYGVEYPIQSEEIKEKVRQTNLERYGVEYPMQSEEVKQKIKRTNLKRYGVENAAQNEDIKEKIKQTNIERYGVEYAFQLEEIEEIKEKVRQTKIQNANDTYDLPYEDAYLDRTNKDRCKKIILNFIEKENRKPTTNEIVELFGYSNGTTLLPNLHRWGLYDLLDHNPQFSKGEREVVDCILSIYPNLILNKDYFLNDRSILFNKETNRYREIDIYFPNLKLGFEYNGEYWHNKKETEEVGYHQKKVDDAAGLGIELVFIWERDWTENRKQIENLIKDKILEKQNLLNL